MSEPLDTSPATSPLDSEWCGPPAVGDTIHYPDGSLFAVQRASPLWIRLMRLATDGEVSVCDRPREWWDSACREPGVRVVVVPSSLPPESARVQWAPDTSPPRYTRDVPTTGNLEAVLSFVGPDGEETIRLRKYNGRWLVEDPG